MSSEEEHDDELTEGTTETEPSQPREQKSDADMPSLESLGPDSDYRDFLSEAVSPRLRRAALRKLFSSPKYNVTDGLDDYAEDYTRHVPLGDVVPAEMRRRLEAVAARADAAREPPPASLPASTTEQNDGSAALSTVANIEVMPASVVEFSSSGKLLIIGERDVALQAAAQLPAEFVCTVFTPGPQSPGVEEIQGHAVITGGQPVISGWLGEFEVGIRNQEQIVSLMELLPGAEARIDLVLDLGSTACIRAEMPPLGYFHPGGSVEALADALAELAELRGTFEKPKFFNLDAAICAHGQKGLRGCSRCIEACPTEAIVSLGDAVQVNPNLCQGGGICATTCPTGAITYTMPQSGDLQRNVKRLLTAFGEAGGGGACIVFHDERSENAIEAMVQRAGHLLPVPVEESGSVGLDTWLSCLAYGARAVFVSVGPGTPERTRAELVHQAALAQAVLEGLGYDRRMLQIMDPGTGEDASWSAEDRLPDTWVDEVASFDALGDKRTALKLALMHLVKQALRQPEEITLPVGAPFGEVRVDSDECTLCMSCVAVCPTSALKAGGELPSLRFSEWNCVQCGLCEDACPEDAISLRARLLTDHEQRVTPRVLHEDEPLYCIICAKPLATRAMLDNLARKLQGHPMFQSEEALRRMQMCGDCRVRDMMRGGRGPRG